ncbi:MAG: hypothetical protein JO035_07035 [Betaproteobacteria bacterium]|nr:hypothetical protein [Betaproteobacteria bacterium]
MPAWPQSLKHEYRVFHPINSHGTTWLRESDLVFVQDRPYAILSWSHDARGDHPNTWCELNPVMLKHERTDGPVYRYEGELQDPAS